MNPPALLWEKEYFSDRSGWFDCVVQTFDGGFAVAASVAGYQTGNRTIIKLDADGNIQWHADNLYYTQFAKWIVQLPDSGYIASGNARVEQGDSKGVFLLRVGPSGDTIWSRVYDLTPGDDRGWCITPLPDGGFAVCGEYDEYDAFVMRTDANGDTLWTKVYDTGSAEKAFRVIYWDGGLTLFIDGGQANRPILLRYNMNGDLLWEQSYGTTFPLPQEWGGDICLASNGGYIIASGYYSRIAQTDWSGNLLWDQLIPGNSSRCGLSVNPTMDGGYIFSGWQGVFGYPMDSHAPELIESYAPPVDTGWTQDGWLVKLDSLGNGDWYITNELGDRHNIFYCARQLQGGGYIVSGRRGIHGYLLRYAPETGIEETEPPPAATLGLVPNPFSSTLGITYSLPERGMVELSVYDLSGRLVGELENGVMDAGAHTSVWDPGELPSGCYIVILRREQGVVSKNCLLVR